MSSYIQFVELITSDKTDESVSKLIEEANLSASGQSTSLKTFNEGGIRSLFALFYLIGTVVWTEGIGGLDRISNNCTKIKEGLDSYIKEIESN